jgi:mandelate racemase
VSAPSLTIRNLRSRAVRLPMRRPLATSSGTIATVPLVLVDLETEEGPGGCSYLFCFQDGIVPLVRAALADLLAAVKGDEVAPATLFKKAMARYRLIDPKGVIGFAISGLDIACWDALAKAASLPLARYLGAATKPVRAYNSCGLGMISPAAAADEVLALLGGGFGAAKVRLGRAERKDDLAVVRAVRKAMPADAILMSDYNQSLTVAEAIARGRVLDGEGLYWIEEPVRHDDYAGNARVAAALETPVQIGENFVFPQAMAAALSAQACDYAMPDLQRIGGVTGWLRAAALADAAGVEMSSHLFPEVSAHLLAATPTAHWLEYVDWADPVLAEPLVVKDGMAMIADRPGHGMEWDEASVRKYAID